MKNVIHRAAHISPLNPWTSWTNLLAALCAYRTNPGRFLAAPNDLTSDWGLEWDIGTNLTLEEHARRVQDSLSDSSVRTIRLDAFFKIESQAATYIDTMLALQVMGPTDFNQKFLFENRSYESLLMPFMLEPARVPTQFVPSPPGQVTSCGSTKSLRVAKALWYIYSWKLPLDLFSPHDADTSALKNFPQSVQRALEGVAQNLVVIDAKRLLRLQAPMFEAVSYLPLITLLIAEHERIIPNMPKSILDSLEAIRKSLMNQLTLLAPPLGWAAGAYAAATAHSRYFTGPVVFVPATLYVAMHVAPKAKSTHAPQGSLATLVAEMLDSTFGISPNTPVGQIQRLIKDTRLTSFWQAGAPLTLADHCYAFDQLFQLRGAHMTQMASRIWGPARSGVGVTLDFEKPPLALTDGEFLSCSADDLLLGMRYVVPLMSPASTVAEGACERFTSAMFMGAPVPRETHFDERTRSWGLPPDLMPLAAYMGEPDARQIKGSHVLARVNFWSGENLSYRMIARDLSSRWPNAPGELWYDPKLVATLGGTALPTPTGVAVRADHLTVGSFARSDLRAAAGTAVGDMIKATTFVSLREAGKTFNSRAVLRFAHPVDYRTVHGEGRYSGLATNSFWQRTWPEPSDHFGSLSEPVAKIAARLRDLGLIA